MRHKHPVTEPLAQLGLGVKRIEQYGFPACALAEAKKETKMWDQVYTRYRSLESRRGELRLTRHWSCLCKTLSLPHSSPITTPKMF